MPKRAGGPVGTRYPNSLRAAPLRSAVLGRGIGRLVSLACSSHACPGPGAIMMLITGGPGAAPFSDRIIAALGKLEPANGGVRAEIARIIRALRTPGDPAQEALKAAAPWVSDLASYERGGYAVFLFIHWQGLWCTITVRAVPEGYGIPFVR